MGFAQIKRKTAFGRRVGHDVRRDGRVLGQFRQRPVVGRGTPTICQVWFCIVFDGIVGIAGGSFLGLSARIIWVPQTSENANRAASAG